MQGRTAAASAGLELSGAVCQALLMQGSTGMGPSICS